jgi:hypothetical protein
VTKVKHLKKIFYNTLKIFKKTLYYQHLMRLQSYITEKYLYYNRIKISIFWRLLYYFVDSLKVSINTFLPMQQHQSDAEVRQDQIVEKGVFSQ